MEANTDEPLERAIATLDALIATARARGLDHSVMFLDMAKLQLQLDLHGITDEEFIAFCDALEDGTLRAGAPASYPRLRREGDLRGQRRSWQCPQDIAMPRGRRRRAKQQ